MSTGGSGGCDTAIGGGGVLIGTGGRDGSVPGRGAASVARIASSGITPVSIASTATRDFAMACVTAVASATRSGPRTWTAIDGGCRPCGPALPVSIDAIDA